MEPVAPIGECELGLVDILGSLSRGISLDCNPSRLMVLFEMELGGCDESAGLGVGVALSWSAPRRSSLFVTCYTSLTVTVIN